MDLHKAELINSKMMLFLNGNDHSMLSENAFAPCGVEV